MSYIEESLSQMLDASRARDERIAELQQELAKEFRDAVLAGEPDRGIRIPGTSRRYAPARELLITDADDETARALFRFLGSEAKAGNPTALLLLERVTQAHGAYYADDAAEGL